MTGSDAAGLPGVRLGADAQPPVPFRLAEKEAMPTTSPGTAGLPLLPPELPVRESVRENEGRWRSPPAHHFTAAGDADLRELAEAATAPLSVIVQVTKRCDFGCVFCSETLHDARPDPGPARRHPGEPGRRAAGVPAAGSRCCAATCPRSSTCTPGSSSACRPTPPAAWPWRRELAGKVAFVNIGFDGPRATFSRVRGDYDKAMAGLRAFVAAGLPVSLSAVVLRSTLHALPYLYQIADVLDAGKLKLILPLRKGNALGLAEREFITVDEARDAFGRLTELRALHDWRPAVRMTPWTAETEGHMIVVEPSGTPRPGRSMTSPTCSSASATCCRSRSPGSGTATPTRPTTSPSTSAPASTPPRAAARDADLHQHGLAR